MWKLLFVIHNLNVNETIENEYVAIVKDDDPRIIEIIDNSPYAKALVENFVDSFGRQQYPSFLIIKDNAPQHLFDIEAIIGFRNIAAIATIIKGHIQSLKNTYNSIITYSDYFNFYPITLTKDGNGFLTKSPSVSGFDSEYNKFTGQTSPDLPSPGHLKSDCSGKLFEMLLIAWEKHFLKNNLKKWPARALFRSLEMAYQASSMPFKNHSTIYDYGSSASLWVSALEILSHPQKGNANLLTVLNLLGEYKWSNKELKRKSYVIKYKGNKKRFNLSQKLYKELYDTRNAFLHGNPVSLNRLKPFKMKNACLITDFAPLLYKIALLSHFGKFSNHVFKLKLKNKHMQRFFDEQNLTKAFLKAKHP